MWPGSEGSVQRSLHGGNNSPAFDTGNTPFDILPHVNGWEVTFNLVVTNTNRFAASIDLEAIASTKAIPLGTRVPSVFSAEGVYQVPLPIGGTKLPSNRSPGLQSQMIDDRFVRIANLGAKHCKCLVADLN